MNSTEKHLRAVLDEVLSLGGRAQSWPLSTPLLGQLPELDSMAVVNILTALEERFDIAIADDEITAEQFESLGSLYQFLESKIG